LDFFASGATFYAAAPVAINAHRKGESLLSVYMLMNETPYNREVSVFRDGANLLGFKESYPFFAGLRFPMQTGHGE
jgi:hypothetical protein